MKNFIIKFMVSYAAMLGTFCVVFFGLTTLTGSTDEFGIAIFGCAMSVLSLVLVNGLMLSRI